MSDNLEIIFFQGDLCWQEPDKNLDQLSAGLEKFLPTLKIPGFPRLLVIPELFTTGFSMEVSKIADEGKALARYSHLAKTHSLFLAATLARKNPAGRGENCIVLLDPEGRELGIYRKIHPFSFASEHLHYQPGDQLFFADLGGFRVAFFICYDLRFPEVLRHAALDGAELFVIPANWPKSRVAHWRTLLLARAIENQAFVVGVNRTGRDPNVEYNGQSLFVNPLGEILLDPGEKSGFFSTIIHRPFLSDYRGRFPALKDIKREYLGR